MAEFADILSDVEASSQPEPPRIRRGPSILAFDGSCASPPQERPRQPTSDRLKSVTAAYDHRGDAEHDACGQTEADPKAPQADGQIEPAAHFVLLETLTKEIDEAGRSAQRLKTLRRKLAWACHPDRWPIEAATDATARMADLNSRVDAAIARCGGD